MNVFISSDIEGTCGVAAWSETEPGQTGGDYAYFRAQMSREVAAACRGALAAGASESLAAAEGFAAAIRVASAIAAAGLAVALVYSLAAHRRDASE